MQVKWAEGREPWMEDTNKTPLSVICRGKHTQDRLRLERIQAMTTRPALSTAMNRRQWHRPARPGDSDTDTTTHPPELLAPSARVHCITYPDGLAWCSDAAGEPSRWKTRAAARPQTGWRPLRRTMRLADEEGGRSHQGAQQQPHRPGLKRTLESSVAVMAAPASAMGVVG